MNIRFFIAILSLSLASLQSCTASRTGVEEKVDSSILAPLYVEAITKSDSVVWHLLDPMSDDSASCKIAGAWEILCSQTDSVPANVKAIKSILTDTASWTKSPMVKESTFLPDVAIEFISKSSNIVFMYSFYCDLCRFCRGEDFQELDGELIRKAVIQTVAEIFPSDRYIRNLKRREK